MKYCQFLSLLLRFTGNFRVKIFLFSITRVSNVVGRKNTKLRILFSSGKISATTLFPSIQTIRKCRLNFPYATRSLIHVSVIDDVSSLGDKNVLFCSLRRREVFSKMHDRRLFCTAVMEVNNFENFMVL